MTEQDDNRFIEQVKQQLDQQAEQLDELTTARLRTARLQALDVAHQPRKFWLPAFGTATAAAIALAVVVWHSPAEWPGAFEDMDIMASGEDLELIEEMDFYDWLDATQTTG